MGGWQEKELHCGFVSFNDAIVFKALTQGGGGLQAKTPGNVEAGLCVTAIELSKELDS
jgi:hypothetical protein